MIVNWRKGGGRVWRLKSHAVGAGAGRPGGEEAGIAERAATESRRKL